MPREEVVAGSHGVGAEHPPCLSGNVERRGLQRGKSDACDLGDGAHTGPGHCMLRPGTHVEVTRVVAHDQHGTPVERQVIAPEHLELQVVPESPAAEGPEGAVQGPGPAGEARAGGCRRDRPSIWGCILPFHRSEAPQNTGVTGGHLKGGWSAGKGTSPGGEVAPRPSFHLPMVAHCCLPFWAGESARWARAAKSSDELVDEVREPSRSGWTSAGEAERERVSSCAAKAAE